MLGLAFMAAGLADRRIVLTHPTWSGIEMHRSNGPLRRDAYNLVNYPDAFPASAEYYRIIDRLTRGEKP